jgi:hypothetical protein
MIWCHSCQTETALLDGECETCRSDFVEQVESESELDVQQPMIPEFLTNVFVHSMNRNMNQNNENVNSPRGNRENQTNEAEINPMEAFAMFMNTLQQHQQQDQHDDARDRTQIHTDMYNLFNNPPRANIPEPSSRQTRSQTRTQRENSSRQGDQGSGRSHPYPERSRPSTGQERERRAAERNELMNSLYGAMMNAMTPNGPNHTNAAGGNI